MKCIILAAGYATRMYPITENLPKSLLRIAGKTILEHILEKIEEVPEVNEVLLVTNAKFVDQFIDSLSNYKGRKSITILNDGTRDNEHRLGAISDFALAIEREKINEDVILLAGDNIFDFSLIEFVSYFYTVNANCITTYCEKSIEALRQTGVIELDSNNRVISFEEKPKNPCSNNAVPPFYIFTMATIKIINRFLGSGLGSDTPGQFIAWLAGKQPIYAYRFVGKRYDIGSLASYEEAKNNFKAKERNM